MGKRGSAVRGTAGSRGGSIVADGGRARVVWKAPFLGLPLITSRDSMQWEMLTFWRQEGDCRKVSEVARLVLGGGGQPLCRREARPLFVVSRHIRPGIRRTEHCLATTILSQPWSLGRR